MTQKTQQRFLGKTAVITGAVSGIEEATVKRYYYQSHDQLKKHLQTFLMAYNFVKRLKTLKGLTAYEYICKVWTKEPKRFKINPIQHIVGLNT